MAYLEKTTLFRLVPGTPGTPAQPARAETRTCPGGTGQSQPGGTAPPPVGVPGPDDDQPIDIPTSPCDTYCARRDPETGDCLETRVTC